MKYLSFILLMFLVGCTLSPQHFARIEHYRAMLPYVSVTQGISMEPMLNPGDKRMVVAFDYDRLTGGIPVVFLPEGASIPVSHLTGTRIGTDSWSTYGIHNGSDDTYRWILTRDNYIGVIK